MNLNNCELNPNSTMKQIPTIFYMVFLLSFTLFSQQTVVKGSVKDLISNQGLAQVAVTFEGTLISTQTNALGEFIFPATVPYGEQVLKLTKIGYQTARYPIVVNAGQTLDIQDMILSLDSTDDAQPSGRLNFTWPMSSEGEGVLFAQGSGMSFD